MYLTFLYISLKNVEYNALVNNYAVTFLFTAWSVCTVQCPSYSKAILTLGFGSIAAVRGLDKDFFFKLIEFPLAQLSCTQAFRFKTHTVLRKQYP